MQTEVEAFLKRILAFPDDDAPRLIFADWLEDQAASPSRGRTGSATGAEWDPERGRFIRIQIALARMKEEESREIELSGLSKRDSAQNEFIRQEQELLDRYYADWIAPFPGPATGALFSRGFVEQLNIGARDLLRYANELFAATPLRHLCLLDVGDGLPGVFQCQYLSRLAALTVHGSHTGLPLARALTNAEQLAALSALRLTANDLEDDAVQYIASCPFLANLMELDLSDNRLGETSAQALAASQHFGALRRLELRKNRVGPVGAEVIAGSEKLGSLQRLGLADNEIGIARLQTLSRTHAFFGVPTLDLSDNHLTPPGLQVLLNGSPGQMDQTTNRLRDLNLSGNPFGDDGIRVLAASRQLENLRTLRLVGCNIGDEGIRVLASSPHLNNVVVLDLSNNPIGDSGCRVLLDRTNLRKLRRPITPTMGIAQKVRDRLNDVYPDQMSHSW